MSYPLPFLRAQIQSRPVEQVLNLSLRRRLPTTINSVATAAGTGSDFRASNSSKFCSSFVFALFSPVVRATANTGFRPKEEPLPFLLFSHELLAPLRHCTAAPRVYRFSLTLNNTSGGLVAVIQNCTIYSCILSLCRRRRPSIQPSVLPSLLAFPPFHNSLLHRVCIDSIRFHHHSNLVPALRCLAVMLCFIQRFSGRILCCFWADNQLQIEVRTARRQLALSGELNWVVNCELSWAADWIVESWSSSLSSLAYSFLLSLISVLCCFLFNCCWLAAATTTTSQARPGHSPERKSQKKELPNS